MRGCMFPPTALRRTIIFLHLFSQDQRGQYPQTLFTAPNSITLSSFSPFFNLPISSFQKVLSMIPIYIQRIHILRRPIRFVTPSKRKQQTPPPYQAHLSYAWMHRPYCLEKPLFHDCHTVQIFCVGVAISLNNVL